jgi:diguanylate cyclase (GGDEF)-like protein
VVLGTSAIGFAEFVFPELAAYIPVWIAYIASSLVMQVLIARSIGGRVRAFLSGIVDVAMITFIVQQLGSVSTMICSIYVLLGIMMALVQAPRVANAIAVLSTVAYSGLILAEQLDVLPYAPAAVGWGFVKPDLRGALMGGMVMATMTLSSTYLVSQVVAALHQREEQLRVLNVRLETLSQRDPLTQLYNRRYLLERIEIELGRVRRGRPAALLMIDLDRFKAVNDAEGHLRGDELLCQIASAISKSTREVDVVSRYGGDEFAILLTDVNPEQVATAAQRLLSAIADTARAFRPHPAVTASIGVAIAESDDDSTNLLKRADQKAYQAKQGGGNRVAV